jgi:hypothetical protein
MDKLHKKIANGFGNENTSPASMAYKMLRESRYVNESMLQYLINYVTIMATSKIVPLHLEEVQKECKMIYDTLMELGLTGTVGRTEVVETEYITV